MLKPYGRGRTSIKTTRGTVRPFVRERARKDADAVRARECPRKGNFSSKSDRIYHLPWQASYAKTTISEKNGERWFCSAADAEKAGWRPARYHP